MHDRHASKLITCLVEGRGADPRNGHAFFGVQLPDAMSHVGAGQFVLDRVALGAQARAEQTPVAPHGGGLGQLFVFEQRMFGHFLNDIGRAPGSVLTFEAQGHVTNQRIKVGHRPASGPAKLGE